MKKWIMLLAIVPFLFACKTKEDKIREKIEVSLKKHFNDFAFKKNGQLNILEFYIVSVDTLEVNDVLLFDVSTMNNIEEGYILKLKKLNNEFDEISQNLDLYKYAGMESFFNREKRKIANIVESAKVAESKLKVFRKYRDSILNQVKIDSLNDRDSLYNVQFFMKSVFTSSEGKVENTLDTLFVLVDKKIEVVPRRNFAKEFDVEEFIE